MSVFDSPLTSAGVNTAWAGWLMGVLEPLVRASFWTDPDAVQHIEQLAKHLGWGEAEVSVPVGVIVPFGGDQEPPGWMLCDGRPLQSSEYPALFAAIGYLYGGGGGTFYLPILTDRYVLGAPSMAAGRLTVGSHDRTLEVANLPPHSHNYIKFNAQALCAAGGYWAGVYVGPTPTTETGEGQAFDNRPRSVIIPYIIKVS